MSIGPAGPVGGLGPVDPRDPIRAVESKDLLPPIQDRIEISETGRLVAEAMTVDPVRAERIDEMRRAIEAGTFDTAERLDSATAKFLSSL